MAALTRLAVLVLAAAVVAAATAQGARSALFFFFEPTIAKPGDRVTVRTAGTPAGFAPSRRMSPLHGPIRLYLVRSADAESVRSRFDSKLYFIGALRRDKLGRGILTFTVPPVGSDSYTVAFWFSRTRRFGVQPSRDIVPRYRPLMVLRVAAPEATESCPVTIPNGDQPPGLAQRPTFHGNGALWTTLPVDGVYVSRNADGSLFRKMVWGAAGVDGDLTVRYRRLDAPSADLRAMTVRGTWSGFTGSASWASRMYFSEGCWQVTGQVRDISLSFVVKVARPRPQGA